MAKSEEWIILKVKEGERGRDGGRQGKGRTDCCAGTELDPVFGVWACEALVP